MDTEKEKEKGAKGHGIGVGFFVISAVCFSLGGVLVKSVPWGVMSLCGARSLLAAVEIFTYMKIRRHRIVIDKSTVFCGLAMTLQGLLYILANRLTTAANAIVLQYTAPIFIILFMWLIFKEKPTKLDGGAVFIILFGVVLFFIDSLSGGGIAGNIIAIISGVAYSFVFMMKKFPGSDSLSSVLIGCVFGAVIGLPFMAGEVDFSAKVIVGVLLIGFIQFGLAYICIADGLNSVAPLTASLISMIEPVLNPILAAVIIHESIGVMAIIGAFIVIGGVCVYNILKERGEVREEVERYRRGELKRTRFLK